MGDNRLSNRKLLVYSLRKIRVSLGSGDYCDLASAVRKALKVAVGGAQGDCRVGISRSFHPDH